MENNNKLYNILAYLGILWIVGLIAAPNETDVRFHVNQGIILTIAGVIVSIIALIPIIGWIVGFVGGIALLVFAILGIVNAAKGEQKELPLIGKFKILK